MAVAQDQRSGGAAAGLSPLQAAVVEQLVASLPEIGRARAERVASAMHGAARRVVRDHLAQHPDALVSGSSLAPPAVQRLIQTLAEDGIDRVQVPACHRCRRVRPLTNAVEGGRVCAGCFGALTYAAAVGVCRECARTRPLPSQGLCAACYARGLTKRTPKTPCAECGQQRVCRRSRTDGRSLCDSCRPRPAETCGLCRASDQVMARWPVGPVCRNCYARVRNNPAPCPACGVTRALIGRDGNEPICGPCSGTDIDYLCKRCAGPSDSTGSLCVSCALTAQAERYFGAMPAALQVQLQPFQDRLTGGDQPRAALSWLRLSASARLLAELTSRGKRISHEGLDAVCREPGRGQAAGYLRDVLVDAGVLAPRDEHTASVERRFAEIIGAHPDLAAHLHAYGYGSVLPRLRGRQRPSTEYVAQWATARMGSAVELLTWARGRSLALDQLAQDDVDQWLAEGASTRHNVRDFLVWAAEDGRAQPLLVPHRDKPVPIGMGDDARWELLQRCLREEALPLEVRVAGALVLLHGQQATRIVALGRACLRQRGENGYLLLGEIPVMLPPALTRLITDLASAAPEDPDSGERTISRWLFPHPHNRLRHRTAASLTAWLNEHGITIKPGRAAALMNAAVELPPAKLAAKLGVHLLTAEQWRRLAARAWTAYLQTPMADEPCQTG
ncbi:hypothetical protein [Streptomyces sp. x-45]|uniref:hypothetical protein n=1 Tax=Streptomyces sp. x-45 TaxID=2789281 RepID=UPI00397F56C3